MTKKLFGIVFALTLVIQFSNLAHADDLLGLDLPSDLAPIDIPADATIGDAAIPASDDLFLGLDLPNDFEMPVASDPAPTDKPAPTTKTSTPAVATTSGSGGKIGAETTISTPTPNSPTSNFVAPAPSSYFNSRIVSANIIDSNFEYSTRSRATLAETGPAATAAFAVLAAAGLTFLIRKKFARV